MSICSICYNTDIDSRCPKCGRLPNDTQLAILTEAFDCLEVLDKTDKTGTCSFEVYQCLKTLTGVVKSLVVENKSLKRELLVLKDEKFN